MSVAPLWWVGAAGEAAAGVSGDQCHGLTSRGEPSGSAERQWDAVSIDDGGPDLGFVGDPEQLIVSELAAVGGFGQPGFGEQILEADGDDHRCRYSADRGLVG